MMKDGYKGTEFQSDSLAFTSPGLTEMPDKTFAYSEEILTSPAFDHWLERHMQELFVACEEPADPRLIELIRRAFPNDTNKVTE